MATGPALVFGQLVFPLNKVTNTVGRKDRITNMVPDVDLGSLDTERSVSRRHAEIRYERGVVTLQDLGSTNGSSVSGGRLALHVDRTLQDGDEVGFGGVNMIYHTAWEWPAGVEAEWPPETGPEETMVSSPEETMIAPAHAEETMVSPPPPPPVIAEPEPVVPEPEPEPVPEPEPEPVAAAPDFSGAETAMFSPEAAASAAAVADAPAPMPEPEPAAMPAPVPSEPAVYVACSNHPHLPAVGVCPGCLEAFCVDCLPERDDGLMVCNRCAGISYRLAAAMTTGDVPAEPVPAGGGFPPPTPAGQAPAPAAEEPKKKWPF